MVCSYIPVCTGSRTLYTLLSHSSNVHSDTDCWFYRCRTNHSNQHICCIQEASPTRWTDPAVVTIFTLSRISSSMANLFIDTHLSVASTYLYMDGWASIKCASPA